MSFALLLLAAANIQADLVVHWKLDEADGDYSCTASGYTEEARGSTVTVEIPDATGVTEGAPGLAPDGGTSATFQSLEDRSDPDPDYILAGSISSSGVHASGQDKTDDPMDLGRNYTITAWLKPQIVTDTIGRTLFGTGLWNDNHNTLQQRGRDLRNYSGDRNVVLSHVLDLDTPVFVASLVNNAGVPDRPAGTVMTVAAYVPSTDTWHYADGTGNPKNSMQLWNMRIGVKVIGQIDDVRVYDTALTQQELEELAKGPGPQPSSGTVIVVQ